MHTLATDTPATTPSVPARVPKHSPWGPVQSSTTIADGIYTVSTRSHGGFKLDRSRNANVPPCVRAAGGWYEEDLAWCWVAISYPNHFKPEDVASAKQAAKNWFPDQYLLIFGGTLDPSESRELRRRAFAVSTHEQYVVRSASGDWARGVPKGMVRVHAHKASTNEERCFLVDAVEYDQRGPFGFVVDERRHTETTAG